jgi:hypothetical protein
MSTIPGLSNSLVGGGVGDTLKNNWLMIFLLLVSFAICLYYIITETKHCEKNAAGEAVSVYKLSIEDMVMPFVITLITAYLAYKATQKFATNPSQKMFFLFIIALQFVFTLFFAFDWAAPTDCLLENGNAKTVPKKSFEFVLLVLTAVLSYIVVGVSLFYSPKMLDLREMCARFMNKQDYFNADQ